ncbi:hypothetical protein CLOM_g9630 [Closterium sp. NIES-68]|nr:hypothetical protein CLOM_g9630 [Closterium sp. NIES-68]GJP57750.1 hypothetical protein CLOP_g17315 [Closterium sp. NIES-67]
MSGSSLDSLSSCIRPTPDELMASPPETNFVGAFWDYENCSIPSGGKMADVVRRLKGICRAYGEDISIRAYGKQALLGSRSSDLQACGAEFVQVPSGKEMADKAMILDVMCFAFDFKEWIREAHITQHEKSPSRISSISRSAGLSVVLITADSGFVPLVSGLRARGVKVVVVTRIPSPLKSHPVSFVNLYILSM